MGGVHGLYGNTMQFYVRNLSILRIWYPWGRMGGEGKSWNQYPVDTEG